MNLIYASHSNYVNVALANMLLVCIPLVQKRNLKLIMITTRAPLFPIVPS